MTFGDLEPDDVVALEPADPEQVARILHGLRRDRGLDSGLTWEELTEGDRATLEAVMVVLLDRLRREGSL